MIAGWREIAKIWGITPPERQQVKVFADAWKLRAVLEEMPDAELIAAASIE